MKVTPTAGELRESIKGDADIHSFTEQVNQVEEMIVLLVTCLAALLCPSVHSGDSSVEWCYHKPECNFTTWPKISPKFCDGSSQSPINIVTASVQGNPNLTSFTFTGFDDNSTFISIANSGDSVVVNLDDDKMAVKGGDLPGLYNTKQFHLHWGNGSSSPGSEHTVDGKQYPMELHIVNVHSKYNGSVSAALAANDSSALAVLGFFIEGTSEQNKTKGWDILTSFLTLIPNSGDTNTDIMNITLGSLLEGVDMTKYYRYQGSLTTPSCNEAVIWTVFKDPIKISQNLINRFSTTIYFKASSSVLMTNTFRGVQPLNGRVVTSQVVKSTAPSSAAPSSAAPSSAAPSSAAPSSAAPSSTAPSSTAPSSTAPSSTAPSSTAPSSTAPSLAATSTLSVITVLILSSLSWV